MRSGMKLAAVAVGIGAAVLGMEAPSYAGSPDPCSTACDVGGGGVGGVNSDGAARGFHYQGPSPSNPLYYIVNVGNDIAGHVAFTGPTDGVGDGAYTPQGVVVGHYAGAFGLWCNGVCG
jgi:hypothetical protein